MHFATEGHGNYLYHKQQYLITNNKFVPVDACGNTRYSKPALAIQRKTKN